MDWREALQRQMYPLLVRLLNQGFILPLFAACSGEHTTPYTGSGVAKLPPFLAEAVGLLRASPQESRFRVPGLLVSMVPARCTRLLGTVSVAALGYGGAYEAACHRL